MVLITLLPFGIYNNRFFFLSSFCWCCYVYSFSYMLSINLPVYTNIQHILTVSTFLLNFFSPYCFAECVDNENICIEKCTWILFVHVCLHMLCVAISIDCQCAVQHFNNVAFTWKKRRNKKNNKLHCKKYGWMRLWEDLITQRKKERKKNVVNLI